MRCFFLAEPPPAGAAVWTPPLDLLRHLRALRLAPATSLLLILPNEEAVVASWDGRAALTLGARGPRPASPWRPLTLATAWPKGPRADELVIRAAECGVRRLLPVRWERSIAGRDDFRPARLARWRKLAREACQQCGNPSPPLLDEQPRDLAGALAAAAGARPVLLAPGAPPLAALVPLFGAGEPLLLVGPEGGPSSAEEALLDGLAVPRAGLLPAILRIEAAGPLAAALFQHLAQGAPAGAAPPPHSQPCSRKET